MKDHQNFIQSRELHKKPIKYQNSHHQLGVITKQEVDLKLLEINSIIEIDPNLFKVQYL